ncbi:outer membrane efflux protein [Xanthomonas oryzae pv. oryzicola BLS256]|uniref:Outer membrane efflux protein n=1 Tax=Xanthomonas oryzae pv. oryzicola (strain BLS256) TaxID=383407 RepID=G7TJQ5_XANOB|nr:outer membrane efflux protein [Xanthomonas oryzae pv. oryzicola BLS256]
MQAPWTRDAHVGVDVVPLAIDPARVNVAAQVAGSDLEICNANHELQVASSGAHARVRATEAGADAALAQFDHTVLQALRDVQTTLSRYAQDLDRLHLLEQAQQQAELASSQNRRLYQSGRTPYLSSLDAERTLATADMTLANAQAQVSQDQIQLFLTLDGGWDAAAGRSDTTAAR